MKRGLLCLPILLGATGANADEVVISVPYALEMVELFKEPGGEVIGRAKPEAIYQRPVVDKKAGYLRLAGLKYEVWVRRKDVVVGESAAGPQRPAGNDIGSGGTQGWIKWNN